MVDCQAQRGLGDKVPEDWAGQVRRQRDVLAEETDRFAEESARVYFPDAHRQIDWSRGQERARATPTAGTSRRFTRLNLGPQWTDALYTPMSGYCPVLRATAG